MNIGYEEGTDYDLFEQCRANTSTNISLWKQRRRSDNIILDKNSSTLSNRSGKRKIGPLSHRISIHKKKQRRLKLGENMNSSVVFTRRNMKKLDLEDKSQHNLSKMDDYSVEGATFKNIDHRQSHKRIPFSRYFL